MDPSGHVWWFAPLIASFIGAGLGAAIAVATGGDIAQAAIFGAISGALFFAAGSAISGLATALKIQSTAALLALRTGVHAFTGAASGALGALATGGDPAFAAATGGISAGVSAFVGGIFPIEGDGLGAFLARGLQRTTVGAILGGGTSLVMGGSFGEGAAYGAQTSAIAYVCNEAMHEVVEKTQDALNADKSKETLIASGKKDEATGRKREIYLGKEPVDKNIKIMGTLWKGIGLATGNPTFSLIARNYKYEMLEEWATFNMKWNFDTGDLIEKTQIHGTEYWKHSYYFKRTIVEPGGIPGQVRFDR